MSWDTSGRRAQLPSNWGTIRRRILERDQHRCTAPTHVDACDGTATEVDHIHDPGDHSDDNLRSLNHWCHQQRTLAQAAAARARRPRAQRPPERHPGLL
jgi:5-methylcytosine-specific restriction enzyme A